MSDVRDPESDQDLPIPNDRPFIQDLVIADMEERKELGLKKYKTLLQSGNGRDMLLDLYQELLDAAVYVRGEMDAREREPRWVEGWKEAMNWLAEHKGAEGIALAEEMGTRLPHTCDSGHFDRSICPEPCGAMHSYCTTCAARQDPCPWETR